MTDPIADMLTRIRNANTSKHSFLSIRSLKMVISKISALHLSTAKIKMKRLLQVLRESLNRVFVYTQARKIYQECLVDLESQSFLQTRVL